MLLTDKIEVIEINKYEVDHIQITIDSSKTLHDSRRLFHDKSGSFDKIIKNIHKAIKNNIKVYIRSNVDRNNINSLPELANVLITEFSQTELLFPYIYLLQDGGCSGNSKVIPEEIGIDEVNNLEKKFPQMKIFKKHFHPSSFIDGIFNDTKFQPMLRHCNAAANQYILDYKGLVYRCWHGIGNKDYSIGSLFPKLEIDSKLVSTWKNRSVRNIEKLIYQQLSNEL